MESEGSLPHSQVPVTCPFPELANSLTTVSEPALHGLLIFQVPNLVVLFRFLGRTSRIIPGPGLSKHFVTGYVFTTSSF